MSFEIKKPPTPIKGIRYEWLEEDRLCNNCGKLVLAEGFMVCRTALGRTFQAILPAKNGICLNCAATSISEKSVSEYERILKQVNTYEILAEKKELTESERKHMKALELFIQNLQTFVEELSEFVEYTENSDIAYYDDQINIEDKE